MKRFILHSVFLFALFGLMMEATLQWGGFVQDIIPKANINGDLAWKPFEEGTTVKGGFKEMVSHYRINAQGYNSLLDYEQETASSKPRIALIGNSYIQGLQNHVEHSIGRWTENACKHQIVVHEFGRARGNLHDFKAIYEEEVAGQQYNFVFVLITANDLKQPKASFKGLGRKADQIVAHQDNWPNQLAIRHYLLGTHGLIEKVDRLRAKLLFQSSIKKNKLALDPDCLKDFGSEVFFLYEAKHLKPHLLNLPGNRFVEIIHVREPYDHGFDPHWNLNGRKNCADAIVGKLEQLGVVQETSKE